MNARFFLGSGLVLMLLAVLLGAFGSHALKALFNPYQIQIWNTATDYQIYHALGLIALGVWLERTALNRLAIAAGVCLLLGILIFSGSLYLLALTGVTKLGMLTPVGGLFFIAGWLFWLLAATLRHPGQGSFS